MDRRNFFKIISTSSAGLITSACGSHSDQLIPLLVPDKEILPAEEMWHPSVCVECNAGCGVIVRVMRGERIIERNGEKLREPIATIKKVEGNPLDPVSGGHLCARGHGMLQALYNPDRLRGPQKRRGQRGQDQWSAIPWEQAIGEVAEKLGKVKAADPAKIVFLTGAPSGTRALATKRFLEALGAPGAVTCSIVDHPLERKAAELVLGWQGLPVYDLARARFALGVGADFLGGWASPVYYSRQFGEFRQGRPGLRGKLVQAESRFSITASTADQWLPVRPGAEPHLLIAVMRLLLDDKLARNEAGVPKQVLDKVRSADLRALLQATGLDEKKVRNAVRELGESEAPLVIVGASVVQSNSLDALVAGLYLNQLLGTIGRPGGVLTPAADPLAQPAHRNVVEALAKAQIVLIDGANPVYTLPRSTGVSEALSKVDTVISFSSFVDDTATYADLILPDHHSLESAAAVVAPVAVNAAVAVATPFVRPLYETRAFEQTLGDVVAKMGLAWEAPSAKTIFESQLAADQTWDDVARQGGLWADPPPASKPGQRLATPAKRDVAPLEWNDAVLSGAADQFPFPFQPYLTVQYLDGRGANLPWMQEMPDPVSSSMWGLPVEVDPKTAAKLQLTTGDLVRVESPHGRIEAPVYVHPAALPGVVSMGIGEGHTHYGRYASGRGANPLAILAPAWEKSTGALVLGSTRVRLVALGKSNQLIQFSHTDRDHRPFKHEYR